MVTMKRETYELLWMARIKGIVALMLLHRGAQPSPDEMMLLLNAEEDLTVRALGELAFDCGVEREMTVRYPLTDDGEEEE